MKRAWLSGLALAGLAWVAAATISKAAEPRVVLVRAGSVFDAEAGRMIGPRDVLLRGERVAEVGRDVHPPAGATIIDARSCFVVPGLIDAHTHVLLEQRFGEPLGAALIRLEDGSGDVGRVLAAAPRAAEYLDAGVTSIRDLGNAGRFLDLMLKQGIARGDLPGPRLYGSGPGLSPAGGQLDPMPTDPRGLVGGEYRIVTGLEDARAAVRDAVARGADVIKMYPEATPQRTRLSVAEMEAIVSEARRLHLPVAAHATSDDAIAEAVAAGVTSVEHGYGASEASLRLMAAKGVWLVPTDVSLDMARSLSRSWPQPPSDADLEAHLKPARDRLALAHKLGVRIALGSDLYIPYPLGRGRGSLATLDSFVEAGMTPAQALRSATWEAGRLIGDDGLGVIRSGAWADLVAVDSDPTAALAPLKHPAWVLKGGLLVRSAGRCGVPAGFPPAT